MKFMIQQIFYFIIFLSTPLYAQLTEATPENASSLNDLPSMTLYKDPYCGCCDVYAQYLTDEGLNVESITKNRMDLVKTELGTSNAPSCHTIKFDQYVIEGHVPVDSIIKLWDEQPDIKGITLPGMPASAPGMGQPIPGSLTIMTIEHSGEVTTIFNQE